MDIVKGYRFRIKTNSNIQSLLEQFAGANRWLYNWALDQRKQYYKACGKSLNYYDQANQLSSLKAFYPWLKDCPSQSLQQTLKHVDTAFKNFFKGTGMFPQFQKRGIHDSFNYPQGFKLDNRRIFLPKIGWIRFYKSCPILGKVKNVTVSREGEHWYISLCSEVEQALEQAPSSEVAIDLGVKKLLSLSTGEQIEPIDFSKEQRKLKKSQRKLSRMKKGSNNWKKQKNRLNRKHRKIVNKRRDYLHKASTEICKNHAVIYVEDLIIPNMSKSAKGNALEHGRNVKAKSGLNRSILQQGWGEFIRQLSYKSAWRNGSVIKIDHRYTSQKCSECGHTAKENRKTQAVFECVKCGHTENADINASKNILAVGQTVSACGSNPIRDRKQEPLVA